MAGFTLLEVIVAVAILAVALSAIFSSQAGAIKMAHRARKTGIASLLARCKMGEIEEQIMKEGIPAEFDQGSDECCEDAELDGFKCNWSVTRLELPDSLLGNENDEQGAKPLAAGTSLSPLDPVGSGSAMELLGGGSGGMIAEMALQYTYPVLRTVFEEQVRRAAVEVVWHEGKKPHSFRVVQFITAPQPATPPQMQNQDVNPDTDE